MKTYLLIILFGFFAASLGSAEIKKHSEKVKGPQKTQKIEGIDLKGTFSVLEMNDWHRLASISSLNDFIESYKSQIFGLQQMIADYEAKKNKPPSATIKAGFSQGRMRNLDNWNNELKIRQAKLKNAMYWLDKRTKEKKAAETIKKPKGIISNK